MSIKQARENAGYTQEDLAKMLGVVPSAVARWETGKNMPRAATLVKMAGIFCCQIEDLLSKKGEPENEA